MRSLLPKPFTALTAAEYENWFLLFADIRFMCCVYLYASRKDRTTERERKHSRKGLRYMKANDRIELDLDELEMVNGGLWDEIKEFGAGLWDKVRDVIIRIGING